MLIPARFRVSLAALAVAGGAAAAAALGPAGPAVGQSSPPIQAQIQVNSPATLLAKGASVNVSVTASCTANTFAFVIVGLSEHVANGIAFGSTETSFDCTGTSQTFTLLMTAGSTGPAGNSPGSSKPFAKGTAIASASIQACTTFCVSQQVTPTIDIVR